MASEVGHSHGDLQRVGKAALPVAREDAHGTIRGIGDRQINVAIIIKVGTEDAYRVFPGAVVKAALERTISVIQQDRDCVTVGDRQVVVTVLIQICGKYGLRIISYGIDRRPLKRGATVIQQYRDAI